MIEIRDLKEKKKNRIALDNLFKVQIIVDDLDSKKTLYQSLFNIQQWFQLTSTQSIFDKSTVFINNGVMIELVEITPELSKKNISLGVSLLSFYSNNLPLVDQQLKLKEIKKKKIINHLNSELIIESYLIENIFELGFDIEFSQIKKNNNEKYSYLKFSSGFKILKNNIDNSSLVRPDNRSNLDKNIHQKFVQVGVVVSNLNKVINSMSDNFAINNWYKLNFNQASCEVYYKEKPFNLKMELAIFYSNGIQLEFIEPEKNLLSTYNEFLSMRGDGIHHLAFYSKENKEY